MIPYDELVAALTQWRTRQGLPTSGRPAPRAAAAAAFVPAVAAAVAPMGYPGDDATSAATPLPEYEDASDAIEGAEVQEEEPGTGEIDVDGEGLDVIDEQEV